MFGALACVQNSMHCLRSYTQPADFQLQICHPPCYELAPLQYLNFEIVPCKEA